MEQPISDAFRKFVCVPLKRLVSPALNRCLAVQCIKAGDHNQNTQIEYSISIWGTATYHVEVYKQPVSPTSLSKMLQVTQCV